MKGFIDFVTKSNALALAIGVVVGTALGSVVSTLVNEVIMPPIGFTLNGVDFSTIRTVLGPDAKTGKEVSIGWGLLINSLIVFFVVMLVVYLVSRLFIKPAPPAGPSNEEVLLTEIRDELRKAAASGSPIQPAADPLGTGRSPAGPLGTGQPATGAGGGQSGARR